MPTSARHPVLHRLAALLLATAMAGASAAELPRLWKATRLAPGGGTTVLYLLADSGHALPAESDAYTTRVVLPALRSAATLSAAGLGEADEGPPAPGCALRQLDETGMAALNDARQRILTLALRVDLERRAKLDVKTLTKAPDPDTQARAYATLIDLSDEFTLLQFARLQLATLAQSAPHAGAPDDLAATLRRARPDLPVHDLDDRLGAMHAYCAAGPQRTLLLRALLDSQDAAAPAPAALTRDFGTLLRGQAPAPDSPYLALAPLDAGLLCARNRGWSARMAQVADGKVHFYVLGVRHLFPVRHDDADCGGVLADLDAAGFKTVLVH